MFGFHGAYKVNIVTMWHLKWWHQIECGCWVEARLILAAHQCFSSGNTYIWSLGLYLVKISQHYLPQSFETACEECVETLHLWVLRLSMSEGPTVGAITGWLYRGVNLTLKQITIGQVVTPMYTLALFWLAVDGTWKHPEKAERKTSFCQRQSGTTSVTRVQMKAIGKDV